MSGGECTDYFCSLHYMRTVEREIGQVFLMPESLKWQKNYINILSKNERNDFGGGVRRIWSNDAGISGK